MLQGLLVLAFALMAAFGGTRHPSHRRVSWGASVLVSALRGHHCRAGATT